MGPIASPSPSSFLANIFTTTTWGHLRFAWGWV
jgi:hypothetical protein